MPVYHFEDRQAVEFEGMLKINGPKFLNGLHELAAFKQVLMFHNAQSPSGDMMIGESGVEEITQACAYLAELGGLMGISASVKQLVWLQNFLETANRAPSSQPGATTVVVLLEHSLRGLEMTCDRIITLLDAALDDQTLLALDKRYKSFWDSEEALPPDVKATFIDAIPDISEASKCIAVERWTASVFHSMRALEVGLNYLCKKLNIAPRNPNWENVLNDLTSAINSLGPNSGPNWKEDKQKLSSAVAHTRLAQRAWRNYVMHSIASYDADHACGILENVRSYFIDLAHV